MVFSSVAFLGLFFPLIFFLHLFAPGRWRNIVLVLGSILFYAWGEPRFVFLILISIAINYRFAIALDRSVEPIRRMRVLTVAVAFNLVSLAVFKYTNFVLDNFSLVLSAAVGISIKQIAPIALPIGISFYTFHAISYLVDIHRKNVRPNSSVTEYVLYIVFFPQLVAGPIIRYKDIYTQLPERRISVDDINAGIVRFTIGLCKKILIANPLGLIADTGFDSPAAGLNASMAWLYLVSYTLQIYFDFSGYSDMAIGLARIFGIRFPENFNYPYCACSVRDFWKRWHITLSTWFRDYVYIPLGGNRGSRTKTARNLWIVFLLTGLWHGASWNFVIWGAIHGSFLMLEHYCLLTRLAHLRLPVVLKRLYTILVVMLAWVFFRANTLTEARDFLFALGGGWSASEETFTTAATFSNGTIAITLLAVALAIGAYSRALSFVRPAWNWLEYRHLDGWVQTLMIGPALTLCFMSIASGQYNPFIYFRF